MKKEIPGFPGYTVDKDGNIFNRNGLALLWQYRYGFKKSGHPYKPYPRVCLYKNKKGYWRSVHRLVALCFVPNPYDNPMVHHLDNNPENPKADNLIWVTYKENTQRAFREGLVSIEKKRESARRYGDHPASVRVEIKHKQTGKTLKFDSIRRLQDFLGTKHTVSIYQAIREPHRTVKGYYISKY